MSDAPVPQRSKTAIPRNPGRHELGMKATLLFPDREIVERYYVPLVYTACRTCYSELDPQEIFRRAVDGEVAPASMQRLISNVIESGHGSTIEHIVFTFALSGVSRTRSHQLVRHRAGGALELHVPLALLVEGDAGAVADELVRQGARDARQREREHDVLDGRAVAGLDDVGDQTLHRCRRDLAVHRAPEDLLRVQLRVAGAAGRVDQRHVVPLHDLPVGEQERRLHPQLVAARVARNRGLAALRNGGIGHARSLCGPTPRCAIPAPGGRSRGTTPSTARWRSCTGR